MEENKAEVKKMSQMPGHSDNCGYCAGKHCGMCMSGHGWIFCVLRWVLGLLILAIVFSIGVRVGEFKSQFGYGSFRHHGYYMFQGQGGYYGYPGMMFNQNQVPPIMMRSAPTAPAAPAAPAK